ncbi:MAG: phenylacetate--CoA ligase family protein [Clostridium sp.]|nr:phenylacetate--CoA ligase family protein [Clostridium sp.]
MNAKSFIKTICSFLPRDMFYSKEYREYSRILNEYEKWDERRILDFQTQEFIKIINHAYENIEFYKELYDKNNIDINSIKSLDDIKKLPIITKEDVKSNIDKFLDKNINKNKVFETYTGGTTSTPMRFYNTKITNEREKAVYNWIWNKFGYKGVGKEACLILRGNTDNDFDLYKYDAFNKYYIVNPINIDDKKIANIINLIYEKRIKIIQAYPSLIYLIAKYVDTNNLYSKVKSVSNIFCSSEKMYVFQRKLINKAFKCKLVDYYGHNERTTLFYYDNNKYIEVPTYGITEVLDETGNSVENNERGYIVGTAINNYAFPLIRYNTKDSCILLEKNNGHILISDIDGRAGDFLVTSSGKYYSPTNLEFAIDKIDNFKDVQIVQNDYNNVDILIVPDKNYCSEDGKAFKRELEKIVDDEMNFHIKIVNKIDKSKNSKSRFVISMINN